MKGKLVGKNVPDDIPGLKKREEVLKGIFYTPGSLSSSTLPEPEEPVEEKPRVTRVRPPKGRW
jgi:hypothetical protein